MKNLPRVLQYFRPDAPRVALAVVLLLLSTVASLLKPWPLALIVDSLLGQKPLPAWLAVRVAGLSSSALLGLLAGAILFLHLLQALLSAAHTYCLTDAGLRGLARVRQQVFQWLQRMSVRFHQGAKQGDMIHRAAWDTYAFHTLFQHGLFTFVSASLLLVLMLEIMWNMNSTLALAALGTIPLLLLVIQLLGREMGRRSQAAHQADGRVTALVQEGIAALPLTQSYAREDHVAAGFAQQVAEALRHRRAQHGWELVYLAAVAVIFAFGVAGIAWLGARQVWAGQLTVGQLLVFLAYLGQFYEPLNQLSHVGRTFSDATAGAGRVFDILDTPEEVQEKIGARPVLRFAPEKGAAGQNLGAPPGGNARDGAPPPNPLIVRGELEFCHVSFAYQRGEPVLQNLSFSLPARQVTAMIGPSGAGKTTVLHLIPRFFDPASGAILLDGVDLRELRLKGLRQQAALVMQEPLLLPGTVAENIAFGKPGASAAEIEAAARAAQADAFITKLPRQYETLVGEGAARLSTGEKQRINLARAFLKDAPILLLDEPTSALDAESEAVVLASLRELARGRTVLMAAHHLSVVKLADQVLVLDQGRLVERGTPRELLEKPGYFARIMMQDCPKVP